MADEVTKAKGEVESVVRLAIRGFALTFGALGAYAVFAAVLNWPAPF